ncbi:agmatine deiminase family protein [Alphaproteobacteria bacterium]|nr:agmatine deiminase family protein [Alphaproteobacteria bacterium]
MKLIPEWQEHESCLIAWPCNNDLYGEIIYEAKCEVANIIIEIAKTEKVIVLCNEEDLIEVKKKIQSKNVTMLTCKLDDSWMRDIAPIFFIEENKIKSVNYKFNGYGKYLNFQNDNKVSEFISNYLKIPSTFSDIVLEGGAIAYDENSNLFSTKNVIFNKNRKQTLSNEKVLNELKIQFNLKHIFLFENGLIGDDTDGHVDNLLCPIGNNKYLIADTSKFNSNYDILNKNKTDLISFFDYTKQKFELISIPLPSNKKINNKNLISSYINFYFTNNKIILPKFNVKEDYEVETIFKNLFPTKEIVMIETSNINYGGGNIHCITMNVPKI